MEFVSLACGEDHVLAQVAVSVSKHNSFANLTRTKLKQEKSGLVLSWGRGESGQLGHGKYAHGGAPRVIEALRSLRISRSHV